MKTTKIYLCLIIMIVLIIANPIMVRADETETTDPTLPTTSDTTEDTDEESSEGEEETESEEPSTPTTATETITISFDDEKLYDAIFAIVSEKVSITKNNNMVMTLSADDVALFKDFNLAGKGITKLGGIEKFSSLISLDLSNNKISSITKLSTLNKLETLYISENELEDNDLDVLSNLYQLKKLDLSSNKITDVSPIKNCVHLIYLLLNNNSISDISPLKSLVNLRAFGVKNNKITDASVVDNFIKLEQLDLSQNSILSLSTTLKTYLKDDSLNFLSLGNQVINIETDVNTVKVAEKAEIIAYALTIQPNTIVKANNGSFDINTKNFVFSDFSKNGSIEIRDGALAGTVVNFISTQSRGTVGGSTAATSGTATSQTDGSTAKGKMPYTGMANAIVKTVLILTSIVIIGYTYFINRKKNK